MTDDPHLQAGFTTPRRAANLLRAIAWLTGIGGVLAAVTAGQSDTATGVLCAIAAGGGALGSWVAAVALDWAAAMFAQVRARD